MGLFGGGKTCAVCGEKAGLLSRQKLRDDNYICSDCQLKVSDQLRTDDYKRLSLESFRKCMQDFSSDTEKMQSQFQETYSIYAGSGTSHKILAADEAHGWWYCAEYNRPMLLKLDEVQSWSVHMDTQPDSDDDKDKGLMDMFAAFAESSYYASLRQNHPELPSCPPGQHVTGMEVYVSLSNPYLREAILDVWKPGWFTGKSEDMSNAYNAAIQVIEFFQKIKEHVPAGMYGKNGSAENTYQRASQQEMDPSVELRKYKSLLDDDIISQEEFNAKKKQLLGL